MQLSGKTKGTILIAEDEPEVRGYFEMALSCMGYKVDSAQDGEELMSYVRQGTENVSAVMLDIVMPRKDGLQALKEIRRMNASLPVIVVSDLCSAPNVVEAMKNGATDFLGKPVAHEDLRRVIGSLDAKPRSGPVKGREMHNGGTSQVFSGSSVRMRLLMRMIPDIGRSEAPVLVQGETGSGKEVIARELHRHSPRADKPFLKLNCAALPSELVESELFGYERGAFTGAFQRKAGMFELADGGTIFLDEIGDMDYKLQAKLLQVLQDHEFQRIGGKDTIRVDVRVIAATHQDLERAISEKAFRQDLLYRLNVLSLYVPPLRENREDIVDLAEFLLAKHGCQQPFTWTEPLKQTLLDYDWPGNVRELENVVRKLLILQDQDAIAADLRAAQARRMLYVQPAAAPAQEPLAATTPILEQVTRVKQQAETDAILAALNATRWNRKQAAALLKLDYKALLYKMKKLGIDDNASFTGERVRAAGAGVS